jgi:ubiquinone/menaquinone biosynthesis C-methylase UbiE
MPDSVVFDRAADYYDETRGFPPGEDIPVADLFRRAGKLTPASRALEVGIGTGRIALPLAAHVRAVLGVDLARPMLERLRARRTTEPVYPVEGDAVRLPFPDGAFDAVVACHVFHLIPDWQSALREVARVLAPAGLLLTAWNDTSHTSDIERQLWDVWNSATHQVTTENVGLPRRLYGTYLPEAGWRAAGETLSYTYPHVFTVQQFLDRLERRVWSRLWNVPDDDFAQGFVALHAEIQRQAIDPAQPLSSEERFCVQAVMPPTPA